MTGRVHPGERNSSYMMEGFIDFITIKVIQHLNRLMVQSTLMNIMKINKKVKVLKHFQMVIAMKQASKIKSNTITKHLNGLMVQSTLVNMLMVKKKVKVLRHFLMVIVMKETGKMISVVRSYSYSRNLQSYQN